MQADSASLFDSALASKEALATKPEIFRRKGSVAPDQVIRLLHGHFGAFGAGDTWRCSRTMPGMQSCLHVSSGSNGEKDL